MKILIGADIVPTAQTEKFFVEKDIDTLFGKTRKLINDSDRVIINLECALTNSDNAIPKFGPNIKADPRCADAIKAVGVTDVMLSNNHVFDYGIEGLRETVENLERVGLPYTGIGENDTESRKPYFFTEKGKKIGIVNVCEHEYTYALPNRMGANPFDPFLTMQDIREAKKQCEYLIVLYHGGKEYCRYPSPRLRNLCREMVLCGADAVITQHSHCVGCYEEYEGGHIVYGQGNFNFCWSGRNEGWYTALLVGLDIEDDMKISFYPIVSLPNGCDLAEGEMAKEILDGFYA